MRRTLSILAAGVLLCDAKVCRSPLNKKFETPCATTVATKGDVSVIKLNTEAVTLVITSDLDPGSSLGIALEFGALMIFKYFTNAPGGQAASPGIILNRTAPLTIRKDVTGAGGWTVWMAASHSQFPGGPSELPAPARYEELSAASLPASTGQGKAAFFAVVNFTTPSLPQESDWEAACALATTRGALPPAFELDGSAPFPDATLALYNDLATQGPWTSECWVGVRPTAQQ
jgi:hypothetical protein